jgi:hypothetical protein
VRIADGHQHLGTGGSESGGDADADPVARSGDDGALAREVGEGDVGSQRIQ